jgi:DnaJ like chaperone protein
LERVAEIFEVKEHEFKGLRARFVPDADTDPYTVLGLTPDMAFDEMRKAWRKLVRENHPDAMIARGIPEEAVVLAEKRMSDINRAWDDIRKEHA